MSELENYFIEAKAKIIKEREEKKQEEKSQKEFCLKSCTNFIKKLSFIKDYGFELKLKEGGNIYFVHIKNKKIDMHVTPDVKKKDGSYECRFETCCSNAVYDYDNCSIELIAEKISWFIDC